MYLAASWVVPVNEKYTIKVLLLLAFPTLVVLALPLDWELFELDELELAHAAKLITEKTKPIVKRAFFHNFIFTYLLSN